MAAAPPRVALRPARDDDRELLLRVYASTRLQELAVTGWMDAAKAAFLRAQFEAQDRHYRERYDTARFCVVEVDGAPAGRLYVQRTDAELRVVDVALLPEHRRRGVGERLLRALLAEADAAGLPATMHVEPFNPARRLYERLGFRLVEERGAYLFIRREPVS